MVKKKRGISKKDKKKRVHRPNKGPMWKIIDGAINGTEETLTQSLSELPDANLDTGLTVADNTQAFWSET